MEKEKSSKKILVVEDDYYFRMILEKNLTKQHYEVVCAENGKQAQQIIALDDEVALVISDIRMPEMTGLELLDWMSKNKPIPIILMTGFSEILETHQAIELGARGFLPKPFKNEDLIAAIESCFPKLDEKQPEDISAQFCKIGIDDFVTGREMKFDIFVCVNEKKYIKVAHGGEDIDPERIRVYKEKNVRYLYVRKDDFKKYLNLNYTLSNLVTESDRISHQKKVNFIKHASEVALQNLYVNEMTKEDYQQTSVVIENAISILSDDSNTADLLVALSKHTDFLYAHSVGVSFYSALLGKKMGWNSQLTIFKLSMGGLLHDIGKKEISRDILEKGRKDQTAEEIALLESHSFRGAEILTNVQCVPTDVLQIVHEHHENCLGFGYPARLKKIKTHPLARVVSVANDFVSLVVKNPNSPGIPPLEAIQKMTTLNPEYYDAEVLEALRKIFVPVV